MEDKGKWGCVCLQGLDFIPDNWKLGLGGLFIPVGESGELIFSLICWFFYTYHKGVWQHGWIHACCQSVHPSLGGLPGWEVPGVPLLLLNPFSKTLLIRGWVPHCSVHLQHSSNWPQVSLVSLESWRCSSICKVGVILVDPTCSLPSAGYKHTQLIAWRVWAKSLWLHELKCVQFISKTNLPAWGCCQRQQCLVLLVAPEPPIVEHVACCSKLLFLP